MPTDAATKIVATHEPQAARASTSIIATLPVARCVAMCDMMGIMETLNTYLARFPGRTQQDWADIFGISRSFFAEIVGGAKSPGRKTMMSISKATNGEVPIAAWFEDVLPPERVGDA